jgi:hypothetical protein
MCLYTPGTPAIQEAKTGEKEPKTDLDKSMRPYLKKHKKSKRTVGSSGSAEFKLQNHTHKTYLQNYPLPKMCLTWDLS